MKVRSVYANGKPVRRDPTPVSAPSYSVELTRREMRELITAAQTVIDEHFAEGKPSLVSALAILQWRLKGRQ